jgi:hypothetical protein
MPWIAYYPTTAATAAFGAPRIAARPDSDYFAAAFIFS